ncbi:hypothetical protein HZB07_02040 [Candidatus Saganbacteria bacterium]|nr:hypothetical protein [Candidatus Saganbacteria bacterium]
MGAWQLILEPQKAGSYHMAADIKLFNDFEAGKISPTLRIYSWAPRCISFGYAQKRERERMRHEAKKSSWETVLRPTGGGIVFHSATEVTYSLVMDKDDPILPKGLIPSYKKISEAIVWALTKIGVLAEINNSSLGIRHSSLCFSYPAEYEIVCNGKKIVGSAQKRGRRALLQQGSIILEPAIDFRVMSEALIEGFTKILRINQCQRRSLL